MKCPQHSVLARPLMMPLHARTRNLEETKRIICYTLDALVALNDHARNPEGKAVGVFDLRGAKQSPLQPCACVFAAGCVAVYMS